jgi:acyl carrier protein
MSKEEIIQKVNSVMMEYFEIPSDKLTPDAHIVKDLQLDSLDAVDMLVHLEDHLGMQVDAEQFQKIKTLGEIYDMIHELSSKKN